MISVAAGSLDHHRGDFSSNGLVYDNSQPTPDRRRRAHLVDRRPDRRLPPGRDGARRRHLARPATRPARSSAPARRPTTARPSASGTEHGLAAHRRRGGRAPPGQPGPDTRPGSLGPPGDGHSGRRPRMAATCRSGRSATATSTSTRPSPSSASRNWTKDLPKAQTRCRQPRARSRRVRRHALRHLDL